MFLGKGSNAQSALQIDPRYFIQTFLNQNYILSRESSLRVEPYNI